MTPRWQIDRSAEALATAPYVRMRENGFRWMVIAIFEAAVILAVTVYFVLRAL